MNVKQQYKGTLENMLIIFENSPLADVETDMVSNIEDKVSDKRQTLYAVTGTEHNWDVHELLGDIEYWNKVEAYKCGFRRAIHIMLDTFFGGESDE